MFYFLKINLIRGEPGMKISKKEKARLPCYCYLLATGGTTGAKAISQTCMRLWKMDTPV